MTQPPFQPPSQPQPPTQPPTQPPAQAWPPPASAYPGWVWTDRGWQPDPAAQAQLQAQHAQSEAERQRRRAHPHPEPRLYPLMLRTWSYRWWKPLLGLAVAILSFLVLQTALTLVLVVGALLEGGSSSLSQRVTEAANLDKVTPATMLYVNLGLASLTLIAWFVVRVVHGLRPRWLASVRPGMRWKFFFACLGLAVVALGASLVVGALLPQDPNDLSGTARFPTGQLLATAIVILVTTPLQALGEEYGFRGYLMQALGSLSHGITTAIGMSRRAAELTACTVALLLTSGLFALAHGTQNFPLFFDRFAFGLMAGLVVILVGGLEAGIALHVLNNLLAFGLAIAYNQLDSTLTVSSASWSQLPVTIVQNGVFLLLVLWVARRMGLRRTTSPEPAVEAEPAPVG